MSRLHSYLTILRPITLAGSFVDLFPGSALNTQWIPYNTPVVSSGQCSLPCDTAYTGLDLPFAYTFEGSAITCEVITVPARGVGESVECGLGTYNTFGGDFIYLGLDNTAGSTQFIAGWRTGGGVQNILATITYNASTMRWWRVRESAGLTYYEYGSNGSSWTVLHSWTTPAYVKGNACSPFIYAGRSSGATDQLVIDNWNNPPVVTPLSFSGCVLWLEGGLGKITHSANAISAWADSSGNSNTANQATGAQKPTRVTDTSNDVASFSTDDVLAVTNHASLNTTSLTIVGAIDCTSFSAFGVLAQKRSGSTGWMLYDFSGTGVTFSFGVNFTTDCIIKSGGGLAGRHTFSARLSGTTAVTKWDGAGGNTNASMGTLVTNAVSMFVGAGDSAGGGPWNGSILDLAVYDNDIGASNTASLEAALKTEWGTA